MATRLLLRHCTGSPTGSSSSTVSTLSKSKSLSVSLAVNPWPCTCCTVPVASAASIPRPSELDKRKKQRSQGSPPPKRTGYDQIGPLQPDSNLRPLKFHIPQEESLAEKRFRQLREETQKWNEEFWAQHNRSFYRQKQAFIEQKLSEMRRKNPHDANNRLTAEELSKFYRQFLDENYKSHKQYNREWYRRNAGMLWPALRVNLEKMFKMGR